MKLTITATAPFDFDLSAKVFSDGDKQIRKYEGGYFWQVIRVGDKLILVSIKSLGNVDEPELSVEFESVVKIPSRDKEDIREIVSSLFNLNFELRPFYEGVKEDEVMSKLTQKLKGLKSPTTQTVFEALIDSIIEQQISLIVAHSLENKVIKAFGETLKLGEEVYYAYPTPRALASATTGGLRKCGLSFKKAEYVKNISKLILEGKLDLDKFKKYEDIGEIIKELDEIKGIGVWTAELTLVRGMQKLEAIPADGLGLRRCISHYYFNDRKISAEEARRTTEGWGKWKGLASFYLIMAERLGIRI